MNYGVAKIFSRLSLSDKKINIKLLGDSITHGAGGTGWEQNGEHIVEDFYRSPNSFCWAKLLKDHLESKYNCKVTNNGCSGTTIGFVIKNFDTLVDSSDDIIVCTIGTNDRHQYFSEGERRSAAEQSATFYNNIKKLFEMLSATGKDFVLVANVPASAENEHDGADYWRIIHMNDIHDMYMKAHLELGFPFIDLYSAFISYCDIKGLDFETLLADGLHPNDDGYRVMYKLLLREMGIGEPMHDC